MEKLSIYINGNNYNLLVDEHETLAKVLRERLNLTGTKIGCELGTCGACTVLVNDEAVLSCISPALKFNGCNITTIEALAAEGKLHKLQEKFVEKGAIQCGFCTPGMVMSSLSFLKENANPSINEIKESISGNLCRCTGYKKIIEAVAEYAAETNNETSSKIEIENSENNSHHVIGKPRPYVDASKKVQGIADYTDDIKFKNTLHCKFLRSIHPHAKIDSIDISEAEKLKGVKAVVTGKDIPITFGVLPISEDETAIAVYKTRYIGEIVAAVSAVSEEIATDALKLIKVKYTPLKNFFSIEESLKEINDIDKIHAETKYKNNLHKKAELKFGDQKKGLEESDHKIKLDFEFAGVNHAFTEPLASAAYFDENGLTIYSATQVPHYLHKALAKVLEIPLHKIRVIKPFLGGGFGGKSDPLPHEIIISYLAKILKQPVRTRFSREEVFITNHGRHPTQMTLQIGADNFGKLNVIDADISISGGAYGSFGIVTTYYNGVLLQAPYKIENFGFESKRFFTNLPPCGAMRGHGAVNPRFAIETAIDELAFKLNIDPIELRLKNLLDSNSFTVGQFRITSNGSKECLNAVMQASNWKSKYKNLPYGKGIGIACGFYISGSALPIHRTEYPQSVVHLKLDKDGRVVIYSGASDIGQGSDTMLALIVAEVLGIGLDKIFVHAADTLFTPIDLGSYSSRVTFMAGNAAKMSAEELKNKMLELVSKNLSVPKEELNFGFENIYSNDKTVNLSWFDAVEVVTRKIGALNSSGYYNSPKLGGNFKGAGAGLSPTYSFGAVVAEVEIDTNTGQVFVQNIYGAHDCGKALNPLAVEGQLEGSWHMGFGQTISEQMKFYNGLILNPNLLDYKVPTAIDTPNISTSIIESCDPEGPFGAKECGEGALHATNPAICNAIYNAVGVRITSLPVSSEVILEQMKKLKFKKRMLEEVEA